MRILALTPMLPWPLAHGGRIRTHALLTGLAAEHALTVVAGSANGDGVLATQALAAKGVTLHCAPLRAPKHKLDLGARLRKAIALARGRSSLLPRFYSHEFATLLTTTLRDCSPDVIMLDHVWMADYLPLLPKKPLLFSTQNVESQLIRDGAMQLKGLGRVIALREATLLERAERELCAAARLVVAVSPEDVARFVSFGAQAVELIPNGVDLSARPLLAQASRSPRLYFVGGADYPPNAEAAERLARHILPLVRARFADAEAWLVGADPEGRLQDLATLPGVKLLGAIPDMGALLREATLLVAPLTCGGGSRLKILEAFAAGRGVVTTRAGAAGLPVEDERELLLRDSDEALAAACVRMLEDAALSQRLITAGRRVAESHDWPDIQQRLRTIVAAAFGLGAARESCA
jgi:glycosyltransferase involved in cell wall biosynthesis